VTWATLTGRMQFSQRTLNLDLTWKQSTVLFMATN